MELNEVRDRVRRIAHWLDIELELPMMYGYVSKLKPGDIYLEVGTFLGASAIAMTLSTPDGVEVHTIDDGSMMAKRGVSNEEYRKKVEGWFEKFGVQNRVNFHLINANEMEWDRGINVLYIDGAHDTQSVIRDIERWVPHVVLGGVAIFHDATTHKSVIRALDKAMRARPGWEEKEPAGSMCRFERTVWITQS